MMNHKMNTVARRPRLVAGVVTCVAVLFLCGACTERMEIATDYAPPRLVITGCVTTDTMAHKIQISRTVGYFGSEQPRTYSNATVTINGRRLQSEGNGSYATDASFYGVGEERYTLDVWVDFDEDGTAEHYTAATTMPKVHQLDSITLSSLRFGSTQAPWMILLHFQDLPGPNYFGGHLYVNDTWYSNKIQRYYLNFFGDYTAEGQYIHFPATSYLIQEEMRWENDTHFLVYPNDVITFELNALSEEYFEFIRTAQQEISGGNPLFAGPPANVPSNLSGGAIGIFGAYTVSRKKLILPSKEGW
jgi:hypothetical protein